MPWHIVSYQSAHGQIPVNEALGALAATDKARVLRVIELLAEYGPELKMPHSKRLQGQLRELRMDGRPNSYRIIYASVPNRKFLLLHLFAKKTQATPPQEIRTAQRRLDDYERRIGHEQDKDH